MGTCVNDWPVAVEPWQESQVGVAVGGVVPLSTDTMVEWSTIPPTNDGACGLWQFPQLSVVTK